MKKTIRQFTLSVPTDQTQPQMVRTFVRASDGTDYPMDTEIQVPVFTAASLEADSTLMNIDEATEQWALAQYPAGTLALSTRDIVTEV